ncbi:hypothetical protein KDH_03170 [Dictyobacter sp. S3.2.2.5]|uniref:Uncharacterized protein n=1 Tax=Dictyobacter halimunensis TaxID=3026934 RepID=A0ABQ6FHE4_9CHLR|nr:hypothetical protein KDH_03170 [Dictyobacter sp. S3.2.2.5]
MAMGREIWLDMEVNIVPFLYIRLPLTDIGSSNWGATTLSLGNLVKILQSMAYLMMRSALVIAIE